MSSETLPTPNNKKLVWAGRILSALPVLMLMMSAVFKLTQNPQAVEGLSKFGYDAKVLVPLGIVEIGCVILYVIPQTAVLGAILLTGYLGGATATHVRVDDPFSAIITPAIVGVIVWLGLYLRDSRLRALVPWRT
jgi:hypothetical protein